MKASKMLLGTLKEAPNEAIIDSHILLIRAGMIRKLVAGVYNFLPLGLKVLHKIENIIREEMDASGAQEILSSAIQPKELWELSKRWEKYGPELIRFKDRHDREFCLGPTHEEIFTDLIKNEVKSYKMLPLNIYQIQTKYRDELRPRFGLMRGREFIMKDAYSFDKDDAGLEISYRQMYETYQRIFNRLQIHYKVVLADTGSIGGSESHQFMALSEVGESNIFYCDACHYAADEEKAESKVDHYKENEPEQPIQEVETKNKKTIEEVSQYLHVSFKDVVKTMIYKTPEEFVAVLVRGDKEVNPIQVCNALNIAEHELQLATNQEIQTLGSVEGFVGPVHLNVKILVDQEVALMKNIIVGANQADYHLINVNFNRDFKGEVGCFRKCQDGDACPICGQPLKSQRGIEVGQIFKLRTKYSESMGCTFLNEEGKSIPMVMGCYGIGVTRTLAAIVEQYHDEHGIIWPIHLAPYQVVIIPINYAEEAQQQLADECYALLKQHHVEVILDDRNSKAGFKFKDWDLIGIPLQIIVGKKASEGIVEFKQRKTQNKEELSLQQVVEKILNCI
jgi:proline--tRNA ligase